MSNGQDTPNPGKDDLPASPRKSSGRRIIFASLAVVALVAGVAVYVAGRGGSTLTEPAHSPATSTTVTTTSPPTVPTPTATAELTNYHVTWRAKPGGLGDRGLTILDAATNLPDGTKASLYFYSADIETPSFTVVEGGEVVIRAANNTCHEVPGGLEGSSFTVTLRIAPTFDSGCIGCRTPMQILQPPEVAAVLGPNFENVGGEQVVESYGQKVIEIKRLYQLPASTCTSKILYADNGDFRQVPVDTAIPQPPGPFPQPPFESCPDPDGALLVENIEFRDPSPVALAFYSALSTGDTTSLRALADPSVTSFDSWPLTQSLHPSLSQIVPIGNYFPTVSPGCGSLVALRTIGASIAPADGAPASVTFLMILRPDGWKVWGWLRGYGR
jgi:hypothetical protein